MQEAVKEGRNCMVRCNDTILKSPLPEDSEIFIDIPPPNTVSPSAVDYHPPEFRVNSAWGAVTFFYENLTGDDLAKATPYIKVDASQPESPTSGSTINLWS